MRFHFLAGLAILTLCACTTPDTGWHLTTGFRGPAAMFLPNTTLRPLPASSIMPESNGTALHFFRPAQGAGADGRIAPTRHFARFGGLERAIPLQPWQGRKLKVSLRLRNDGGAFAFVMAQVNRLDGPALRTALQGNAPAETGWRTHQIVLQVPDNATYLFLYAGFTGAGEFWLDGLTLDLAPADAPATPAEPLFLPSPAGCTWGYFSDNMCGPIMPDYPPPPPPREPPPPPSPPEPPRPPGA
jgi:hypothetical protein